MHLAWDVATLRKKRAAGEQLVREQVRRLELATMTDPTVRLGKIPFRDGSGFDLGTGRADSALAGD